MIENYIDGPRPPQLALGFYLTDGESSANQFRRFVSALLDLGTEIVGGRDMSEGDGFKTFNTHEYQSLYHNNNFEFSILYGYSPLGLYSPGYHDEAVRMWMGHDKDNPPVGLITEYGVFQQTTVPANVTPKIDAAGKRVVKLFEDIIEAIQPAYAAISGGDWLESPSYLKVHGQSTVFQNFYLNTEYIGLENINYIRQLYKGAYIKEMPQGIYISCHPEFNPEHVWMRPYSIQPNPTSETRVYPMHEVARIIATHAVE